MTESFRPTLAQARELGRDYRRVPVTLEIAADMETPVRLLKKLKKGSGSCFLLESMEGGEKWGRYSFIGCDPVCTVTAAHGRTVVSVPGRADDEREGDPFEAVRELLAERKAPALPWLPRFAGGAVGFFGYDMVRYAEKLPDTLPNEGDYPDMRLLIVDRLVAYDNVRQKLMIIVSMPTAGDMEENYRRAVEEIEAVRAHIRRDDLPEEPVRAVKKPEWRSNFTQGQFEEIVRKAKENIRNGDVFQVVLSRRFTAELEADLFDGFRVLRIANPAPYMYYLKLGDVEIAGASPETLVRLENGRLETCPIAGSRPRGRTEEEDRALEQELLSDEKERAEHNMLVDLGRNDIGRVSRIGSVQVKNYAQVARYSHIMHLTTLVTGELGSGRDAFDALRSLLPAGTLSGAPKVRAMELIEQYENRRRGPYGGAVGYIGFDGNMDVCIAIRTIAKKNGVVFVQAGAGIVADSVPEREYIESENKAKAVLLAAEQAGNIR